jgi:DNA-binding NarL/FixJ family response regulator
MSSINVLIVDDHAEFRGRVRSLLSSEEGIQVVGEAENGEQAFIKAASLNPDLVLIDIRMPLMNGLEATRHLTSVLKTAKVIILSQYDIDEYRLAAAECGASDYVVKKFMTRRLIPAIRGAFSPSPPNGCRKRRGCEETVDRRLR